MITTEQPAISAVHRAELPGGGQSPGRDELPVLISALALLFLAVAAGVWDNFPVNDDWVYAHAAKLFAATGELHTGSLTTLVGQTLLGGFLIRLTGFSHVYLRVFTIACAILMCWMINRILQIAEVSRPVRIFSLLVVVLNPISAHLAFSFMTEYYGYGLAMGGVLVWFYGRTRADLAGQAALIPLRSAIMAAVMIGASFWIRQFCVAAFPAVLVTTAFAANGDRRRLRSSISAGIWATLAFSSTVLAYFLWAHTLDSGGPAFNGPASSAMNFNPMANLLKFDPLATVVMSLCAVSYATLFMLPNLAALPWRPAVRRPMVMAGLGYLGAFTAVTCAYLGQPDNVLNGSLHKTFPYLRNVLYNAGIGPLLTPDLHLQHTGKYGHWDVRVIILLEVLLILAHVLWAALPSFARLEAKRREIAFFGMAFALLSLALIIQASHDAVFDRYLFPVLLGGTISMACLMSQARLVWWRGAIVLGTMALFTAGGVHDYFAFNRARWQLAAAAQDHGVRLADMNGGWEINGWSRSELPQDKPQLPLLHPCPDIYCLNDAFVIGTIVPSGYRIAATRRVRYWLTDGPELLLCRRNDVENF